MILPSAELSVGLPLALERFRRPSAKTPFYGGQHMRVIPDALALSSLCSKVRAACERSLVSIACLSQISPACQKRSALITTAKF